MRILIIDDDQHLRDSVCQILSQATFVVDTAEDGEQGASLACVNPYDLIILDYNLPKKNGSTVCQQIRARGYTVPILVLSVVDETNNKIDLLNVGADDYLTKPFSPAELLARVHAILRRPKIIEHSILRAGDLSIDLMRQIVKRGKKTIELTQKQFLLLEQLLKHQDQVVSRSTLLEHAWDRNADPFSNTLETHISELRRKIDHNFRKKIIHTVPGRGYKLSIRV